MSATGLDLFNATRIFDWLSCRDNIMALEPEKVSGIFIAGGGGSDHAVNCAEIYRLFFGLHIFSVSAGGRFGGNLVFGIPESKKYREILRENRVPSDRINIPAEGRMTMNTKDEMIFGLPFMESILKSPIDTILLMADPYHQRRAYCTAQKWWEGKVKKIVNVPSRRTLHVHDLHRLVMEYDRIVKYGHLGDLVMPDIPREIVGDVEILRGILTSIES